MPDTLREYDEARREVRLSEGLDHPNRAFQLAHVIGLIEQREVIDAILARLNSDEPAGLNRCKVVARWQACSKLTPKRRDKWAKSYLLANASDRKAS